MIPDSVEDKISQHGRPEVVEAPQGDNELLDSPGRPLLSDPEEGGSHSGRAVEGSQLSRPEIFNYAEMLRSDEVSPPKKDVLEERVVVFNPLFQDVLLDDSDRQFSIVSYDIMAELETDEARSQSGQGGRGVGKAAGVPESDIVPINHNERLIKELHFLQPDIFCLQSVSDSYWYQLEKIVNNMGYGGARMKRRPGPLNCSEAIFYKIHRFDLEKIYSCYLDDLIMQRSTRPDVTMNPGVRKAVESRETLFFLILRCKNTGRKLIAANTRCAPMHKLRPDLQTAQVCAIVQLLKMVSEDPDGKLAVVLCGNLDFEPTPIGPYQVMRDGAISDVTEEVFKGIESVIDWDGKVKSLFDSYSEIFCHSMQTLRSAYERILGAERQNVWKSEDRRFICGSYVWFDEGELDVVGVLDNVPSVITESGIPDQFFPSCSFSLKSFFRFKAEVQNRSVDAAGATVSPPAASHATVPPPLAAASVAAALPPSASAAPDDIALKGREGQTVRDDSKVQRGTVDFRGDDIKELFAKRQHAHAFHSMHINAADEFSIVTWSICRDEEKAELTDTYIHQVQLELQLLDADIYCIQSIPDSKHFYIAKMMNNLGCSKYYKRRRADTSNFSEAIFVRNSRFDMVESSEFFMDELIITQSGFHVGAEHKGFRDTVSSREVVIMVALKCRRTGKHLVVANMKTFPKDGQRPDLQTLQVCSVLKKIKEDLDENSAIVFCGNIECEASDYPYNVVKDGALSPAAEQAFQRLKTLKDRNGVSQSLASYYPDGFRHDLKDMTSAYQRALTWEQPSMWRAATHSYQCASYIFYDSMKLNVVKVLRAIPFKAFETTGLPSPVFPSSALSLKAFLVFKDKPQDM